MTKRVVVGMSGGVDSSVAALLLVEQGFEVHGVFMKNWEDAYDTGYCSALEDFNDARDVCHTLGIPLHQVNFIEEYRQRVFSYFLAEYQQGRTPNPDVLCNKEIKFKAFLDYANRLGADAIATGHYARRIVQHGYSHLLKGVDPQKDQSYFLHTLDQTQLNPVMFPVGELYKTQVRQLAVAANLITQDKKDSTGICFIGERNFREFLSRYLPSQPGDICTPDGKKIGEHAGLMFYTIGQRQGLGIGGYSGSSGEPWYVVHKDPEHNLLIVGQGYHHPWLFHRRLYATQVHWITSSPPALPFRCHAKIRYRQQEQPCCIETLSMDSQNNISCQVLFDQPQRAITTGQSVVFYMAEECLGGGIIQAVMD